MIVTIFDSIKYPVPDTESGLPPMYLAESLPPEILKEYQKQFAIAYQYSKFGEVSGVNLLRKVILEYDSNIKPFE